MRYIFLLKKKDICSHYSDYSEQSTYSHAREYVEQPVKGGKRLNLERTLDLKDDGSRSSKLS